MNIDAWWTDSTEPDHLNPKESDFDLMTADGSFRSVHNAFPLNHNRGIYEHQRAVSDDKRVFQMTRSGYLGQQHYGALSWSGDVVSTPSADSGRTELHALRYPVLEHGLRRFLRMGIQQ